jgi:magnesium transporter
VIFNRQENRLETLELDIFLGKNFLVTHHEQPIPAIQQLWETIRRDARHVKSGADHLLYRLLDEVVDGYLPVVEGLEARIESFEEQIFGPYRPEFLEQIFTIKRAVLQLRRFIDPQREVLNKLARDEYPVIDAQARVYFRDVYDHLVRMHDITESIRDTISGTLDTYLSLTNNRMNEVMKTLTTITTLFMPISFVVGFFGMNFFAAPEPTPGWTVGPVFYLTMIGLIVTPIGLYLWMRRQGWM